MSNDPYAELDEQLGYDADHNDSSQYCKHGTWIGSWWGPDYLCHACEMGYDRKVLKTEYHVSVAEGSRPLKTFHNEERAKEYLDNLTSTITKAGFNALDFWPDLAIRVETTEIWTE